MKISTRNLLAVLAITFIASRTSFAAITPEIDPAMGAAALALLAGAIMVIRGRNKA